MVYNGGIPYHGKPWYDHVVTHHGRTIVYHGLPWYTMVYIPWYTMVYHVLVNHGKPWYDREHGGTIVHHGIVWCTNTMVHHGVLKWRYYHGTTTW